MIGLIFGDTDFPKEILKKIKRKKLNYIIIDLSKNNSFKKDKKSNRVSIGQFGKIINLLAILLTKIKHIRKLLKKQERGNGTVRIFLQDLKLKKLKPKTFKYEISNYWIRNWWNMCSNKT